MESLLSFLGSAAFGGVTGLLGGLVNRVFDFFTTKARYQHEEVMLDKNLEITKVEAERAVIIAREQAFTERELAEYEAMGKSFETDKVTFASAGLIDSASSWVKSFSALVFTIVDFIRGMTRPGITLYMCILTTLIYFQIAAVIEQAEGQVFTPDEALKIIKMLVEGVIYLTTMAVGWWFATRAKAR
ncbi:MAG: hypothetical protein JW943_14670 [Deltaproteobacteria bacterium]|nr:hypothetical protein [Deltaproteobacteria bacterium]